MAHVMSRNDQSVISKRQIEADDDDDDDDIVIPSLYAVKVMPL